MKKVLKLSPCRVWRTYVGGKLLNIMYDSYEIEDNHYPESWIASITEARNPDYKAGEGLSFIENSNETLLGVIRSKPAYYLGPKHVKTYGDNTGILVKFLDAAERLTIQVHPDKLKARKLFQSDFGKTEAWHILGGRLVEGEAPHIYLGFKPGINRKLWEQYFHEQDIERMLGCMHKIYVNPGETYLIEGGLPHAIGPGCFIMEIQEPTDYTIRVEKLTPKGLEIPDALLHQGLGFKDMFECFDYTGYVLEDLLKKSLLKKKTTGDLDVLISDEASRCFTLEQYHIGEDTELQNDDCFSVLVVTEGRGELLQEESILKLKKGDQVFIPYNTDRITLKSESDQFVCMRCKPPKP